MTETKLEIVSDKNLSIDDKVRLSFAEYREQMKELKEAAKQIYVTSVDQIELMEQCRVYRLKCVPIRTGIGKRKDKLKENILLEDRAIMKVHNEMVDDVKEIEAHFLAQENFAKIQKENERKLLQAERAERAAPYIDYMPKSIILCDLEENDFVRLLEMAKGDKIKAEEAQQAQKTIDEVYSARIQRILPYKRFTGEVDKADLVAFPNDVFEEWFLGLVELEKEESEALKQAAEDRKEVERLQAEANKTIAAANKAKEDEQAAIEAIANGEDKEKLMHIVSYLNERPVHNFTSAKGIKANDYINDEIAKLTQKINALYVKM